MPELLITAICYLTFGQILVFTTKKDEVTQHFVRQFPQFWLLLMPGVLQLFILKGALWKHQYWESPLAPFIAVATALAIMLLFDTLKSIHRWAGTIGAVLLAGFLFAFCVSGVNYYYNIQWP